MKKYTQRIFNLPQEKVEAVNNLMAKFGNVEFKFEKIEDSPDTPEQLTKVYYKNYEWLETFFEFYQFYFYRSGKQEILKYEENVFQMVRGILTLAAETAPDRTGNVKIDLTALLEHLKKEFNISVSNTQWQLLENKGLFSKRAQTSDGKFYIAFHLDDYQKTYLAWRFLREIAKWNTTGTINPKEPEFPVATAANNGSDLRCSECQSVVTAQQKFCGECGTKLTSSAA